MTVFEVRHILQPLHPGHLGESGEVLATVIALVSVVSDPVILYDAPAKGHAHRPIGSMDLPVRVLAR